MKIREDLLISVINDYIDEIFNGFTFNTVNVLNKIGAKIKAKQLVCTFCKTFGDEQHKVDVDTIENMTMPEIRKLGVVEIPGIGNKYTFNENDFIKLFAKIKEKATEE